MPEESNTTPDNPRTVRPNKWQLRGQRTVLGITAVLLTGIVLAPLSLSAEHIMEWAADSTGLGLYGHWPWVVFYSLDATALVCVLLSLYATWRGEAGTIFRLLVWTIAGLSAFANYRYGLRPEAPADTVWFFPVMSLSAPLLLEVVLHKVRHWVKQSEGRTASPMPSFGVARWIPGVGAFQETYCSWRVARLKSLSRPDAAITEYRRLNCGWRVLSAIQAEHRTLAQADNSPGQSTHVQLVRTDSPPEPDGEQSAQGGHQADNSPRTVRAPNSSAKKQRTVNSPRSGLSASDEELLAKLRAEYPDRTPNNNQIRTTLADFVEYDF